MNDERAVQLILQNLEEPLAAEQQSELAAHLESSPQTRHFAELVRRMENSLSEWKSVPQSGRSGPGLADVVKARLQRQLERAILSPFELGIQGSDASGTFESPLPGRRVAESEDRYTSEEPPLGSSGSGGSDSPDDIP